MMNDDNAHDLTVAANNNVLNPSMGLSNMGIEVVDPASLMQNNYQSPYLQLSGVSADALAQPEFLFPTSATKRRSFFQRAAYTTGAGYVAGSVLGSLFGVYEGLRHPAAKTNRLRVNTILNAVGKRGPFLGNTAATLAVMYHGVNYCAVSLRGGTDDFVNELGSGALAGAIFRSASGLRATFMGAVTGLGLVVSYYIGRKVLLDEDIPISMPSFSEELKEEAPAQASTEEEEVLS